MKLNGKQIDFYTTSQISENLGPAGCAKLSGVALVILEQNPVDMLVFEATEKGTLQVRLAGYYFYGEKRGILEEELVVLKTKDRMKKPFWLKVDDYGDRYVATFLFPEEY